MKVDIRRHGNSLVLALLLAGLAGSGVSARDAGVNRHRQVETGLKPFAVHNEQLREIMMQLNALVSYGEQPSMPLDEDSKAFLQELISTVRVVAESASSLQTTDQLAHLDEQKRARFRAMAEQLYEEAVNIDINAREMDLQEMNRTFLKLNQTCTGCHTLFRGL